jgi:processive 1,2-diacylglycerol beta-glucosyltransferase
MRILILSTSLTGMAHNTVSSALTTELEKRGVTVKVIEIYDFVHPMVAKNPRNYAKFINDRRKWKFWYDFADKYVKAAAWWFSIGLKKRLPPLIKEFDPDTVIAVHQPYVSNILDLRKQFAFRFKFVVAITDLISIPNFWIDDRSDLTIFPTVDGVEFCKNHRKDKIQNLKYTVNMVPLRPQFLPFAEKITLEDIEKPLSPSKDLNVLLMSGGDGTLESFSSLDALLNMDKIKITVVCGKNKEIKQILSEKYSGSRKLQLLGFVEDFAALLDQQDIVILRAGVNSILEALNLCKPIIMSSVIYGQELGNIDFVVKNKIGFYCPSNEEIVATIKNLIADDFALFKQIRKNQYNFREPGALIPLVEKILSVN